MPLVNTTKMFKEAYDGGFAIGAFNVNNMEILQGVVEACKLENSPVILQISKGARSYANIKYLKALMDVAEAETNLPIAIHCDHGDTMDLMKECIADGYTSVMIDASHDPFEQNVAISKEASDYAHQHGVVVEAELGMLGGIEEDVVGVDIDDVDKFLTNPAEAKEFVKQTGCDSLAIACGTSHGAFKFKTEPKLALHLIDEIAELIPGFPLVMHGSSSVPRDVVDMINKYGGDMANSMGVPDHAVTEAASRAVCKVNVDTDLRLTLTAHIRKVFTENPSEFDPRKYLGPGRKAITELVQQKLHVLGCAGKADLCR